MRTTGTTGKVSLLFSRRWRMFVTLRVSCRSLERADHGSIVPLSQLLPRRRPSLSSLHSGCGVSARETPSDLRCRGRLFPIQSSSTHHGLLKIRQTRCIQAIANSYCMMRLAIEYTLLIYNHYLYESQTHFFFCGHLGLRCLVKFSSSSSAPVLDCSILAEARKFAPRSDAR